VAAGVALRSRATFPRCSQARTDGSSPVATGVQKAAPRFVDASVNGSTTGGRGSRGTRPVCPRSADQRSVPRFFALGPVGDIGQRFRPPRWVANIGHTVFRCIKRGPMSARRQNARPGSPQSFAPWPTDAGLAGRGRAAPAPAADNQAAGGPTGLRADRRL
jgi:hypothetical protein